MAYTSFYLVKTCLLLICVHCIYVYPMGNSETTPLQVEIYENSKILKEKSKENFGIRLVDNKILKNEKRENEATKSQSAKESNNLRRIQGKENNNEDIIKKIKSDIKHVRRKFLSEIPGKQINNLDYKTEVSTEADAVRRVKRQYTRQYGIMETRGPQQQKQQDKNGAKPMFTGILPRNLVPIHDWRKTDLVVVWLVSTSFSLTVFVLLLLCCLHHDASY